MFCCLCLVIPYAAPGSRAQQGVAAAGAPQTACAINTQFAPGGVPRQGWDGRCSTLTTDLASCCAAPGAGRSQQTPWSCHIDSKLQNCEENWCDRGGLAAGRGLGCVPLTVCCCIRHLQPLACCLMTGTPRAANARACAPDAAAAGTRRRTLPLGGVAVLLLVLLSVSSISGCLWQRRWVVVTIVDSTARRRLALPKHEAVVRRDAQPAVQEGPQL